MKKIGLFKQNYLLDKPEKNSTWTWHILQISLVLLPFIPSLAVVLLVIFTLVLWQKHWQKIILDPLTWSFICLSFWLIINSSIAYKPIEAWLGLANFLPFFCLAIALIYLIQSPQQLNRLAWLLVLPSPLIVSLGMGQLYGNFALPNILGVELIAGGVPPTRMASIFSYANILAIYLLIIFSLNLGLFFLNYFSPQTGKFSTLIILGICLTFNIVGLVLTNSRNAWALSVLVALAFALYIGWRWLVLAVSSAIAAIAWATVGVNPSRDWFRKIIPAYVWSRLSDQMYPDRPVNTLRITQWQFASNLTQQRPWQGWGLRNFSVLYEEKTGIWFGHPHNLLLMFTAEIGIIGTILFSLIIGFILVKAIIVWQVSCELKQLTSQTALIIYSFLIAFISCLLFNFLDISIYDLRVNTIGWLILGCLAGLGKNLQRSSPNC